MCMTTSRAAPTMMMTKGTETQPHHSQQRPCPVAGHCMRIVMVGAVALSPFSSPLPSSSPSLSPSPSSPPLSPSHFSCSYAPLPCPSSPFPSFSLPMSVRCMQGCPHNMKHHVAAFVDWYAPFCPGMPTEHEGYVSGNDSEDGGAMSTSGTPEVGSGWVCPSVHT